VMGYSPLRTPVRMHPLNARMPVSYTERHREQITNDLTSDYFSLIFGLVAAVSLLSITHALLGMWGTVPLFIVIAASVVFVVIPYFSRTPTPKLRVEVPTIPDDKADWDARFSQWKAEQVEIEAPDRLRGTDEHDTAGT